MFVDVRHPLSNKLLFRYDQERRIVETWEKGVRTMIDLAHAPPLITYHGDPAAIARMTALGERHAEQSAPPT